MGPRLVAADEGERVGHIADTLRVSVSYVSKVLSRRRLAGQTTAQPQRCHVVPKLSGQLPAIQEQLRCHPDATIAELRAWLLETQKISASTGLMHKTLAALDLTYKKGFSTRPSRRGRTSPRHAMNGEHSSPS